MVPQGSVLSPTLLKFYVYDAPLRSLEVKLQSYSDNFHAFVQLSNIVEASGILINYLNELHEFFN